MLLFYNPGSCIAVTIVELHTMTIIISLIEPWWQILLTVCEGRYSSAPPWIHSRLEIHLLPSNQPVIDYVSTGVIISVLQYLLVL
jgi:hypothetical protein